MCPKFISRINEYIPRNTQTTNRKSFKKKKSEQSITSKEIELVI